MDKPVVQSKDDQHTIHDLTDFAFSKEVVRDHPRIIAIYTKLLPVLYEYAQYQGVWPTIQMVEDSKLLLELQYDYYKRIYDRKGKVERKK